MNRVSRERAGTREIAILTFLSLDGVMQGPGDPGEDPSGGFELGGWARPWWDEVMDQVRRHAMERPGDLLLGRRTYDLFAAHWPNASGPEADRFASATKYVVTSEPATLDWGPVVPIGGDVVGELERLRSTEGPLLQVHGSSELIQTLLDADLVDEMRLWTFPVVLGRGKRLLEPGTRQRTLRLTESAATSGGVTMRFYRRDVDLAR